MQFSTSANGVPLTKQSSTSTVKVYKGSEQFRNFTLGNVIAPAGITATATDNTIEITVSPTAAIAATNTVTFNVVISGGATISKSITVNRLISNASESTVVEYTV